MLGLVVLGGGGGCGQLVTESEMRTSVWWGEQVFARGGGVTGGLPSHPDVCICIRVCLCVHFCGWVSRRVSLDFFSARGGRRGGGRGLCVCDGVGCLLLCHGLWATGSCVVRKHTPCRGEGL